MVAIGRVRISVFWIIALGRSWLKSIPFRERQHRNDKKDDFAENFMIECSHVNVCGIQNIVHNMVFYFLL